MNGTVDVAGNHGQPSSSRRPHALVVDDNDVNRRVLVAMLNKLGINSTEAASGRQALAHYRARHFDAIFMDWHMPDIDGLAATGEIRRLESEAGASPGYRSGGSDSGYSDSPASGSSARRTPIIAVTASALEGDREQCLHAGMDDYLSKPTTLDGLRETVAAWIARPQPDPSDIRVETGVVTALDRLAHDLGDESIVYTLIDTFMDELPAWRSELTVAANDGDVDVMVRAAHTTKSAARSMGLDVLADRCQALETAGHHHDEIDDAATAALRHIADEVVEAMDEAGPQLTAYKTDRSLLTAGADSLKGSP